MAQIRVNEISQNYAYSVGNASFATVALPITASWGPGFIDPDTVNMTREDVLERTSWQRFPATRAGLEAFVATYRGPASNYRIAKDYSYYQAMTLLTAGYDILVCRLCPGAAASAAIYLKEGVTDKEAELKTDATLALKAKYPGTFGNNLLVKLKKVTKKPYWNLITYIKDTVTGVTTAVENLTFYFDLNTPQDNILHVSEVESDFLDITVIGSISDTKEYTQFVTATTKGENGTDTTSNSIVSDDITKVALNNGTDVKGFTTTGTEATLLDKATALANERFRRISATSDDVDALNKATEFTAANKYVAGLTAAFKNADDQDVKTAIHMEWLFRNVLDVYDLLKDKLTYNPNRIISPGWDDISYAMPVPADGSTNGADTGDTAGDAKTTQDLRIAEVSPIHCKLMEVAYYSRCACAYLDIPKALPRKSVYNESVRAGDNDEAGYAQMLSRVYDYAHNYAKLQLDEHFNEFLYPTHSALFAPWGQYAYTGLSKMNPASPAFLALMIERAMIKNQSTQYEWIMPTVRRHKLNIGKLDYTVSKKLLDEWQKLEGVGVNVVTSIPDMGVSIWGNSTLFETPPATYQALANLSTRKLMNAVKDISYRCGLAITFQYNNEQAYSAFYAGVTPTLDNMKNAGAIEGYKISMAADINGVDRVNANTVIGVITLYVNGVINDINIDLIAMPAGAGLE